MVKDILIELLKSTPLAEGKIIVDVRDIKEIKGSGWDYTLIYRPKEDPFSDNIISFHNGISDDEYNAFESEYLKEKERKKTEFDKVKVFRNKYNEACQEYQTFMNQNTTEDTKKFDSISDEAVYVTMERAKNPDNGFKEVQITTENVGEFRTLSDNMTKTRLDYQDALVKFHKNETI